MGNSLSVVDKNSYKLGWVQIRFLGGARALAERLNGSTTSVRVSMQGVLKCARDDERTSVPIAVRRRLKSYIHSAKFIKDLKETILHKDDGDGRRVPAEFAFQISKDVASSLDWKVRRNANVESSFRDASGGTKVGVDVGFDLEFTHPDLPESRVSEACALAAGCMAWHIMHGTVPVDDRGLGDFMLQVGTIAFKVV